MDEINRKGVEREAFLEEQRKITKGATQRKSHPHLKPTKSETEFGQKKEKGK
jgi:hypothetical protein